jgi:hypothetical protein
MEPASQGLVAAPGQPAGVQIGLKQLGEGQELGIQAQGPRHRGHLAEVDGDLGVVQVAGLAGQLVGVAKLGEHR